MTGRRQDGFVPGTVAPGESSSLLLFAGRTRILPSGRKKIQGIELIPPSLFDTEPLSSHCIATHKTALFGNPVTMKTPGHLQEIGHVCRPAGELLANIGSKWVVLVLIRLSERPKRFSELKREIGTISQKVLTGVLRDLERNGIVDRTVTPSIPPRVDYCLTELGCSLLEPIHALGHWAVENEQKVSEARARYDARIDEVA